MKIETGKGWMEVIIEEDCSQDRLMEIADILRKELPAVFDEVVGDTDSYYGDFTYRGITLTLHYNTFIGISVFPKSLGNSTPVENTMVVHVCQMLYDHLGKPVDMLAKYFTPDPVQWGLRGDPHLWREMRLRASSEGVPKAHSDVERILHALFLECVGEEPENGKIIYVPRYNTGGMSGGGISCDFWLEKAFPLIMHRYLSDLPG